MKTENQVGRLEIHDFQSDVIRSAIAFIYRGDLYQPMKDNAHWMQVARFGVKYQVEDLVVAAFETLSLETSLFNVAEILNLVESADFVSKELKKFRKNLIGYVVM